MLKQDDKVIYDSVSTSQEDGSKGSRNAVQRVMETMSVPQSYLKAVYVLLASGAWLGCSSAIILVNRHLMINLEFAYPMAVSTLGMTCSALFAFLICDVLRWVPSPKQPMDVHFYFLHIFPVGLIQAICLFLSNQLYLLLTIAFIEMSKATLPVFTMAALYAAGLESPNLRLMTAGTFMALGFGVASYGSVHAIMYAMDGNVTNSYLALHLFVTQVTFTALGCGVAAYGEVHLTSAGMLCTFASLTMESARLVMTQFLLVGCSFHALQGLKYIAPACVLCLGLGSFVVEYADMVEANAGAIVLEHIPEFIISAGLGVIVNLLGLLIIKLASATTLKVLAAVRGPLVIMAGVFIFLEKVTTLQFIGYSTALAGFTWYNISKAQQVVTAPSSRDTLKA